MHIIAHVQVFPVPESRLQHHICTTSVCRIDHVSAESQEQTGHKLAVWARQLRQPEHTRRASRAGSSAQRVHFIHEAKPDNRPCKQIDLQPAPLDYPLWLQTYPASFFNVAQHVLVSLECSTHAIHEHAVVLLQPVMLSTGTLPAT